MQTSVHVNHVLFTSYANMNQENKVLRDKHCRMYIPRYKQNIASRQNLQVMTKSSMEC